MEHCGILKVHLRLEGEECIQRCDACGHEERGELREVTWAMYRHWQARGGHVYFPEGLAQE